MAAVCNIRLTGPDLLPSSSKENGAPRAGPRRGVPFRSPETALVGPNPAGNDKNLRIAKEKGTLLSRQRKVKGISLEFCKRVALAAPGKAF